jgi:hypothetical protein
MSLVFREFLDQFAVEPPHLLRAFDHQWIRENDRQIGEAVRRSE